MSQETLTFVEIHDIQKTEAIFNKIRIMELNLKTRAKTTFIDENTLVKKSSLFIINFIIRIQKNIKIMIIQFIVVLIKNIINFN